MGAIQTILPNWRELPGRGRGLAGLKLAGRGPVGLAGRELVESRHGAWEEELRQRTVREMEETKAEPSAEEQQAIAALVDEYSGTLYRVAYSVLRNAADAEDAVQEAFIRVLKHRESLKEIRDKRVWLVRIVWNVTLDRKRRKKTRPETDDVSDVARYLVASGLSPEERTRGMQHHAMVLKCLAELPEREREVLTLTAFEELNSVEIAEILGVTESSVRSRLFRARNQMAELLQHKRGSR